MTLISWHLLPIIGESSHPVITIRYNDYDDDGDRIFDYSKVT